MSEPASSGPGPAPGPVPPVFGRPSSASSRPAQLRSSAEAGSAAYRADGGDGGGWSVRAASVAGVRHRLAGLGPEDAYGWRVVPGAAMVGVESAERATVVLAVADGVGSVTGSAAASAAAVDAACNALVASLSTPGEGPGVDVAVRAGVGPGWSARGSEAGGVGVGGAADPGGAADLDGAAGVGGPGGGGPGGDGWRAAFTAADAAVGAAGGATTLVVAVIGSGGRGQVARIGDSAALILSDCRWRELWPAGEPDDGSVPVATAALPATAGSVPAFDVVAVTLAAGEVLVLVTDGIANPLRDGPTTVAPALAEALRGTPSPLGLTLVADFSRQGCFDDRTIVGLWPAPDDTPGR